MGILTLCETQHGVVETLNKMFASCLQDMCSRPECNCQKQINFTHRQFQLEGFGFKNKLQNFFRGTQTTCNEFLEPALFLTAPIIGMAVGAQTKNPQVAPATTIIIKLISGEKILSFTDMHGNGLRLKVM